MNTSTRMWKSIGLFTLVAVTAAGVASSVGLLGEGSVRAENTSTAGADHNDGVQYVLERMPPDWRSWCLACDPGPCDPMYDLDAFIAVVMSVRT